MNPEIITCSANNLGFYFLTKPFDYKEDIWKKVSYDAIQPQFKVHEIHFAPSRPPPVPPKAVRDCA
jgi:hypothetical protein